MPACAHPPRCVLKSAQDGWEVWAGRRGDCLDEAAKFDVLINLSGSPVLERHHIPLAGFERWENQSTTKEVLLDWPDMGVVALPAEFWCELIRSLGQTKAKTLVFCVGGHGRTGTALACLMVACGWTSADAVAWIRKNYCSAAIETRAQETYIKSVERGCVQVNGQEFLLAHETRTNHDRPVISRRNLTAFVLLRHFLITTFLRNRRLWSVP